PRCSRRPTSCRCAWSPKAWWTGCGSTIPTASPTRPATWRGRSGGGGRGAAHPDALADPAGYLARLREGGVERVWVEKILEAEEKLRDWPVSGTVGYEFLNDAAALFVDPAGEAIMTDLYRDLTGERRAFH